ncbi:MAG: radical SAM protein [Elusimicrobiota bacterium]
MKKKEFLSLITFDPADKTLFEDLAQKARALTISRFGRVKSAYIPLYLSNECDNTCLYCGFNKSNKFDRKTLSADEISAELETIYKKGFKNILLVSGEKKDFSNIYYLADAVRIAKNTGFHSISVEVGALDENLAKTLVDSGAQGFVLYQETYNRAVYSSMHISGKKTDYDFRFAGPERAVSAGFRHITLGFLAGLADLVEEAQALYEHISYLKKKYWEIEYAISIPRITNAKGINSNFIKVSDKKFAQILMAFRIAFPDMPILMSTRESEIFRTGMTDICVSSLSIASKTCPGGYSNDNKSELEQFSTTDNRRLEEIVEMLKSKNYDICFKDWQCELNER